MGIRRAPYPLEVRQRAVKMVFEHGAEYPSQWARENRELRRANEILKATSRDRPVNLLRPA